MTAINPFRRKTLRAGAKPYYTGRQHRLTLAFAGFGSALYKLPSGQTCAALDLAASVYNLLEVGGWKAVGQQLSFAISKGNLPTAVASGMDFDH